MTPVRIRHTDVPIHSWTGPDDVPGIQEAGVLASELVLAGATMPPEILTQRAVSFEVVETPTPGWRELRTPRARVQGDAPIEGLRTSGVYAEELNALLQTALGGDAVVIYHVKLFNDQQAFRKIATLAQAPNAESYYAPNTQEMVFWFGQYATPELFQRAFAHEFTHAYMDRVWGIRQPLWFAEGMAEYFSNLEWIDNQLVAGGSNPRAIALLLNLVPLSRFLMLTRGEFYDHVEFPYHYAQAWALIHFLYNRKPQLVDELLRKGMVRGLGIEGLDTAFRNYVERTLKGS